MFPDVVFFVCYIFDVIWPMNKIHPRSRASWSSVSTGQPTKFPRFLPVGPPAPECADTIVPHQCAPWCTNRSRQRTLVQFSNVCISWMRERILVKDQRWPGAEVAIRYTVLLFSGAGCSLTRVQTPCIVKVSFSKLPWQLQGVIIWFSHDIPGRVDWFYWHELHIFKCIIIYAAFYLWVLMGCQRQLWHTALFYVSDFLNVRRHLLFI